MDRDERVAGHGRASVLSAAESGPGHARVRRVRRGAVRPVLRRDGRPSQSAAGDLFPAAVDWVLRGDRFGARDCLAHRGFAGPAGLPGVGPRRGDARALDDFANAAPDRSGDAPGGLHLDPAGAGNRRPDQGKTIGIDATTLEANAALRSIVRRDSGETYQEFLTRLAQASGIETPTRADLARLDRKRPKKGRNTDWRHPHDPDARITKMKDGRTHLAHKAEHAVDLETGAIVGVTVQGADQGDTTTIAETVTVAADALEAVAAVTDGHTAILDEVVADKGYHSNQTLVDLATLDLRTYIAEPDRGRRHWTHQAAARDAVYANRRRIRGVRGWPCRVDVVSISNDRMRISMKPVGCGARICGGTPTS